MPAMRLLICTSRWSVTGIAYICYTKMSAMGGSGMQLWWQWWSLVAPLRTACARQRSFLWLLVALAGLCARADLLGVTSIVRTLSLAARCYDRLLDFFHSPAVDVDGLTRRWVQRVLQVLPLHRFAGRPVLLGDGIKVAKAGRR